MQTKFSPPNDVGQISTDGVLIVRNVGVGTVTATRNDMSVQFFIRIAPGELAMLRVEPELLSMLSNPLQPVEPQQFSVNGFDLYGNLVSPSRYASPRWSVTGGIGAVTESGLFTPAPVSAGSAIIGTVVASAEGIYGSASVTVISEIGDLTALQLLPESTRVPANRRIEIRVIGRDDRGNLLPAIETPIALRLTPEVGFLDGTGDRWHYRAPTNLPAESDRRVNLRVETTSGASIVSAEVPIELVPSSLAILRIEPEALTIRAGDVQTFRLTASDDFGNIIASADLPEPPSWRLSNPLGELTDTTSREARYMAKQVGTTRLTVRAGNAEASAEIQISSGELVSLKISPEDVLITAGDEVEFRLTGVDGHGNRVDDLTATWRVIGFDDSGPPEGRRLQQSPNHLNRRLWKPKRAGKGRIEARWTDSETGKALTVQVPVQVTPGQLASLEIQLIGLKPPYVLISGGRYSLEGIGRDTFGNEIDGNVTWHLVGDLGRIVTNGGTIVEAVFVGEGRLVANAGDISAEAQITIRPTAATIGKSGGRLESPAGFVLDVPAGALGAERNIEISIIESPGAAFEAQRITRVLEIRPRRTILKRLAQLTFSYAQTIVNQFEPAKLSVYFWDDFQEKWIPISSRVDPTAQTVSASVNHFAPYTLMESEKIIPRSDELRVENVRLTPPVFYAPETNRLTIEYILNAPNADEAQVTIEIFDFRDRHVVMLLDRTPRRIGRNAEQWDGRTDNGETVRNGRYVMVIIVEAEGETVAEKKLLVVFK